MEHVRLSSGQTPCRRISNKNHHMLAHGSSQTQLIGAALQGSMARPHGTGCGTSSSHCRHPRCLPQPPGLAQGGHLLSASLRGEVPAITGRDLSLHHLQQMGPKAFHLGTAVLCHQASVSNTAACGISCLLL